MDGFRIANFVIQAVYLPLHLFFFVRLIKRRLPTPIWGWFIVVVAGLWLMVSGRFLETVAYLFVPVNGFYVFAVYYQLVGTTLATFAYLFWNLYLAGSDRLADHRLFRGAAFFLAGSVCLIVCTNDLHRLFYEKLVMGEPVVHGKLFTVCLLIVYGTLFAGYIVSVVHILRKENDKIRRLIVFSLYPILPAAAALIRSLTGVDRLDYTPVVMTVSILCLYLMVFHYRYVHLLPSSIESALAQTRSAIFLYDAKTKSVTYRNRSAEEEFSPVVEELLPVLQTNASEAEGTYGGKNIKAGVRDLPNGDRLVTVNDLTALARRRELLREQIGRQRALIAELEEKKRNVDAYLESL